MMGDFYGLIENASDEMVKEWLESDPKNLLFTELYIAELAARKGGKRKTYDTHAFEVNLFENLIRLRDALWNYDYVPSRGTAHVIFDPVQREIFAAPYVDRVVHHYIVNALLDWWERRLNYDSCSCRKGRGTSFGIARLDHHVRQVSQNFTRPCYVIKMDISGYFMHIKRDILYERVLWGLDREFEGCKDKRYKILRHAIHEVIFDNPVRGVKIQGSYEDWRGLPEDKSLFCQPPGQGMVIGNLTSQFFSNVYLDVLDRFITIDLGYKHYGRYVDDFYVVVTGEELAQAKMDVKAIATFLEGIGMKLNFKKTRVIPSWQGVPFLGMVVRNGAIMPGKRMTRNFTESARALVCGTGKVESVVSYLGMLCHYDAKKVSDKIFDRVGWEYRW
ncbi:RNA-directed DNA polymerase [Candidatus Saccharibacteria bacterium]|nr:RNA-directed DNA polymerase [Candidatus Saccharibacteria bacterium]